MDPNHAPFAKRAGIKDVARLAKVSQATVSNTLNHPELVSPARREAVEAAIDPLAFGVLQALLRHGVRVPDDVSLVGYDDIPDARHLSVPLTSVRRPHHKMGTTAAEMLTNALSGGVPERRHVVFQPELVVRETTGAPTRANATERKST